MGPQLVAFCSLIITILIIAWDIWLYTDGIPGNTITRVTVNASKRNVWLLPLIAFVMGGIPGHFTYPEDAEAWIHYAIAGNGVFWALGALFAKTEKSRRILFIFGSLIVGYAFGGAVFPAWS